MNLEKGSLARQEKDSEEEGFPLAEEIIEVVRTLTESLGWRGTAVYSEFETLTRRGKLVTGRLEGGLSFYWRDLARPDGQLARFMERWQQLLIMKSIEKWEWSKE